MTRRRIRRWVRRAYRRWLPDGPEYVPPSEWWPLLGVCGLLLGATSGGNPAAALFGIAGILALIVYAVRWLRDRERQRYDDA